MDLVREIMNGRTEVTKEEILQLTGTVRDLYRTKKNCVEIPLQNVIFVGDLHGEFESITNVLALFRKYENHSFVFLGDYADRGPAQIETFNLVIAMALSAPYRVIMLRGNHESDEVAQRYGFYAEVTRKFSFDVYQYYLGVFENLPIAAFNHDGIFACHGGVPEGVSRLEDIQAPSRYNKNFPNDIIHQIVWNDPKEADFRFAANRRGGRVKAFGRKAFSEFSDNLGVELFFRAHEVVPEGVRTFFDNRLYSIFSATYRGAAVPKVVRLGGEFQTEIIAL
ncbi:MAG: metallophosphoesterase [Candidatus Thorarchaeota archaeon]